MSLGILPVIAALAPIAAAVAVPLLNADRAKKDAKAQERALQQQQAADMQAQQAAAVASAQRAQQNAALAEQVIGAALVVGAGYAAWKILGGGKPKRRRR